MDRNKFNKELDKECRLFLKEWGNEKHIKFMEDIAKIVRFYDVVQKMNLFEGILTEEENIMMQAVCTVFLVSKFAENQAENLIKLNFKFKDLWKKIEQAGGKLPDF